MEKEQLANYEWLENQIIELSSFCRIYKRRLNEATDLIKGLSTCPNRSEGAYMGGAEHWHRRNKKFIDNGWEF